MKFTKTDAAGYTMLGGWALCIAGAGMLLGAAGMILALGLPMMIVGMTHFYGRKET
jgi:hypothetical protein